MKLGFTGQDQFVRGNAGGVINERNPNCEGVKSGLPSKDVVSAKGRLAKPLKVEEWYGLTGKKTGWRLENIAGV